MRQVTGPGRQPGRRPVGLVRTRPAVGRAPTGVLLLLLVGVLVAAGAVLPGTRAAAAVGRAAGPGDVPGPATHSAAAPSSRPSAPAAGPVVLVGIPGLRWQDVSRDATPVLWRLAAEGSIAALSVRAVHLRTCPMDGWLTLNAGARSGDTAESGPCPPVTRPAPGPGGNVALGPYAAAGMLAATWLAGLALLHGARRRAVLAVATVGAFTVIAAGWPGFGSKFGGTVAMVPGFVLLGLYAAGARITRRRVVAVACSGVLLVSAFAVINWLIPTAQRSHTGGFVQQILHGGAGAILQRKISANVGSLTGTTVGLLVPVVVVVLAVAVFRPDRLGLSGLVTAYSRIPLLRAGMIATWVTSVFGWFADDSGVTVPASALSLAVPLTIATVAAAARPGRPSRSGPAPRPSVAASASPAADGEAPLT